MTLSYGAAVLAGLLSFLSPCVLPLVPGYLGFLNGLGAARVPVGVAASTEAGMAGRLRLVLAATLFVAGFLSVFVALGVGSSLAGGFVARHLAMFQLIGGGVIALLGIHFLGLLRVGFLDRDVRFMPSPTHLGTFGAFVVGLAFGFGWTPCVGPVLAAILMISASSTSALNEGAALLLAYGVGMGTPFVLVALFSDLFLAKFTFFSKKTIIVKWLLGGVLVITGLAIMLGKLSAVGFWLLRNVAVFQGVG